MSNIFRHLMMQMGMISLIIQDGADYALSTKNPDGWEYAFINARKDKSRDELLAEWVNINNEISRNEQPALEGN